MTFTWEPQYTGKRGRRRFNKLIAVSEPVQDELEGIARVAYSNAKTALAEHRDQGHAQIDLVGPPKTDVDWHVVLSDMAGEGRAAAIEFGRGGKGIYVLHRAFGQTRGGLRKKGNR